MDSVEERDRAHAHVPTVEVPAFVTGVRRAADPDRDGFRKTVAPEARHPQPLLDQRWRLMRPRKVASGPPAEGVAGADLLQPA